MEAKINVRWEKIKSKLLTEKYRKVYLTGSNAGRFYGSVKVNNIDRNNKVDKLPLRTIVFNIVTATYELAKYLAKLLSPLSKSGYTVQSPIEFMDQIKTKAVPHGYHLISFDVISLFMNAPLNATIDIALKHIYDNREINKNQQKGNERVD